MEGFEAAVGSQQANSDIEADLTSDSDTDSSESESDTSNGCSGRGSVNQEREDGGIDIENEIEMMMERGRNNPNKSAESQRNTFSERNRASKIRTLEKSAALSVHKHAQNTQRASSISIRDTRPALKALVNSRKDGIERFESLDHPILPTTLYVRFHLDNRLDKSQLQELLSGKEYGLADLTWIGRRPPYRNGDQCSRRYSFSGRHPPKEFEEAFIAICGRQCEERVIQKLAKLESVQKVEPIHEGSEEGVLLVKRAEIKDYPVTPRNRGATDLGRGAFGTVQCGLLRSMPVAMKSFEPKFPSKAAKTKDDALRVARLELRKELEMLKRAQLQPPPGGDGDLSYPHNNIVMLYAVTDESPKRLVLELCETSLYNKLHPRKILDLYPKHRDQTTQAELSDLLPLALTLKQRLRVCKDVAAGLRFLHSKRIIHRDIKSGNILLKFAKSEVIAKIADFGSAKILPSLTMKDRKSLDLPDLDDIPDPDENGACEAHSLGKPSSSKRFLRDSEGRYNCMTLGKTTHEYCPPEGFSPKDTKAETDKHNDAYKSLKKNLKYHWSLDSYSVGVVFWEVFTNLVPFNDKQDDVKAGRLPRLVWEGHRPNISLLEEASRHATPDKSCFVEISKLLRECLQDEDLGHEESRRPSSRNICEWLEKVEKVVVSSISSSISASTAIRRESLTLTGDYRVFEFFFKHRDKSTIRNLSRKAPSESFPTSSKTASSTSSILSTSHTDEWERKQSRTKPGLFYYLNTRTNRTITESEFTSKIQTKRKRTHDALSPSARNSKVIRVCVTQGPHRGDEFDIVKDSFKVGKKKTHHFCLSKDRNVSKDHAIIEVVYQPNKSDQGVSLKVTDDSTNGTFVDESQIPKTQPVEVRPGQTVRMGHSQWTFCVICQNNQSSDLEPVVGDAAHVGKNPPKKQKKVSEMKPKSEAVAEESCGNPSSTSAATKQPNKSSNGDQVKKRSSGQRKMTKLAQKLFGGRKKQKQQIHKAPDSEATNVWEQIATELNEDDEM